jgi:hypothetical protein
LSLIFHCLQGVPLSTPASLGNLLHVISSLAMKGSTIMGELPHFSDWTASTDMVDLIYVTTSSVVSIWVVNTDSLALHCAGLRTR